MRKTIFLIALLTFLHFFIFNADVYAHPGNTDAYGCHTCRTNCPSWGYFYGEYHCHTPKYYIPPAPVYVPVYIPPPRPQFPSMTATWKWAPNDNRTFNLEVTLNDSNPTYYSAVISQYAGGDPGPLTDFTSNKFNFYGITPGKHYLNVKKAINGVWSTVSYWTVDVPEWYPPPTPTLIPTPTNEPFISGISSEDRSFFNGIILVLILFITYKVNKKYQILKRLTSPIDLSVGQVFSNALITWVVSIVCFLILLIISNADFSDKSWVLIVLVLCTVGVGVIAFAVMGISFCLIVLKKIVNLFKKSSN